MIENVFVQLLGTNRTMTHILEANSSKQFMNHSGAFRGPPTMHKSAMVLVLHTAKLISALKVVSCFLEQNLIGYICGQRSTFENRYRISEKEPVKFEEIDVWNPSFRIPNEGPEIKNLW